MVLFSIVLRWNCTDFGANDVQEVWRSRLSSQQSFILNLNASSSLCYKYLLTQPGASAGARRRRPPARGPRVYQPSRQLFSLPVRVMTVISLIVLSGDIQINPGPLQFGCLNCCSAAPKVPLIHDLMNDNSLDVLLLYRKRGLPRTLHSLSYSTLPHQGTQGFMS